MAVRKTVNRTFLDTSAIIAYINAKDPNHADVRDALKADRKKFVITNYIFDEIITLVNARLGHETAVSVGNILINSPEIESIAVSQHDETEAWKLFAGRPDKQYSFTDCTSFVIMKRMNIVEALALDEHFRQEGFKMTV